MRVVELFSGIGGCAEALRGVAGVEVVAAVDQDLRAAAVYRANHPHPLHIRNLVTVKTKLIASFQGDLWWMSPPCAPHTIRGTQADLDDRRSEAFMRVVALIGELRPRWIALENVPWFAGSRSHALLVETLDALGYPHVEGEVCPTELGMPGVRRRFYLVAGEGVEAWPAPPAPRGSVAAPGESLRCSLASLLDAFDPSLMPDAKTEDRFRDAFHVVDADDPRVVAACFTSAYGRSPVYCGSWVSQRGPKEFAELEAPAEARRVRRLSPSEIARLHGFRPEFQWADVDRAHAWRLVGNSLSVPVVRHILRAIPQLRGDDAL
jgi:site-specific DNA-cytosine methylase